MGRRRSIPLLAGGLLLAALGPSGAAPPAEQAALQAVEAAVREGMEALGLEEADLRPRHDFIPADPYRLALVDDWLERPAAVAREAHARFRPWVEEEAGLSGALRRAYETLGHGEVAPPAPPEPAPPLARALGALYGEEAPPSAASLRADLRPLSSAARAYLARLLVALREVVALRTSAFEDLSDEEWVQLRKFGSQFNTGMPPHLQVHYQANLHDRVRRPPLLQAALVLARVLDDLPAERDALVRPRGRRDFHLVYETPAGRVEIGGWGPNTYAEDALLTVDLGGDDVYTGSAGGTLYTPHKVSVAIDLGGDDRYETEVGLAQGSGMYGVGVLVDAAGDDLYASKNVSQGAGHVGVGVLWDWEGDDRYRAHSVSQGAGFEGVGLLQDEGGRDRYEVGWMGQGYGTTRGLGVLRDGEGNDAYAAGGAVPDRGRDPDHFLTLAQGHGQGNRADDLAHCTSGGIGLLADRAGDDTYEADVFGQGCAYWYAIGVLLDAGGDDRYRVFNYGQGGGFHMAVGALLDLDGEDRYEGRYHAQGHALDRSVAWLVDWAGDDRYEAESDSTGCAVKPFAVGFLADVGGDDRYVGGTPGYVRIPAEGPDGPWPKAFFLDLGGEDVYSPSIEADAGNGRTWVVNTFGWGLDR